eukprot:5201900-Pleurochrysis_carterae.AAC.1
MTPGAHDLSRSEEEQPWAVGARGLRPLLSPAFPVAFSSSDSVADALLRCERANARLRAALS